jgi:hypothetical protein
MAALESPTAAGDGAAAAFSFWGNQLAGLLMGAGLLTGGGAGAGEPPGTPPGTRAKKLKKVDDRTLGGSAGSDGAPRLGVGDDERGDERSMDELVRAGEDAERGGSQERVGVGGTGTGASTAFG